MQKFTTLETGIPVDLALQELLRDSRLLDDIQAKKTSFNPFEILKITHTEIRHSNVLSWLFEPMETHGLGDWFLRTFLVHIALNNDLTQVMPLSAIYSMDLEDAVIYREYKHIDIYIESKKNNLKVLIENKIYAKESKTQLRTYHETIQTETQNKENRIIPVFLTLEGDDPEGDKSYFTYSHEQLLVLLAEAIEICKKSGKYEASQFISYYKQNLGELIMVDSEVVSLCKAIYKKHKIALDAIYENAYQSDFDPVLNDFFSKHKELSEVKRSANSVVFLHEKINRLPEIDHQWVTKKPVVFWVDFEKNQDRIKIILEVGPMDSSSGRISFLTYLKNFGAKTNKSSFQEGSKYTRIVTMHLAFDEWNNTDETINKLDQLYDDFIKKVSSILERITDYDWINWQHRGDVV